MTGNLNRDLEKLSAPLSVYLNLTQECNMRCIYCSAEVQRPNRHSECEISDEEYLRLVDQLLEAKVFKYIITGGEPLLRRELVFGILEKIGKRGQVLLNTNATMINGQVAKRLAAFRGNLGVATSIDAPVEEINAITRGKGFLRKTLNGARKLMEQGIRPNVNCVLTRHNYRFIPQLVELLEENGFKSLFILHFQPLGYGASRVQELKLTLQERLEFNRILQRLRKSEMNLSIHDQDEQDWSNFRHEEIYRKCRSCGPRKYEPGSLLPCSAGVGQCNILADGEVTPCNFMSHYRCGNVRQQGILDIWRNSPQLGRLRALRSTPVTAVEECSHCQYSIFCRGGCRAIGYAEAGNLLGHDSSCPYFENRSNGAMHLPVLN